MRLLRKIKQKWHKFSVLKYPLGPGPGGGNKVSLVIYFDYEREYGNGEARYSAQRGFEKIIKTLSTYNIKATWNCVGLVAERYPETIHEIIKGGHEVACHTYSHIVPLTTSKHILSFDIDKARMVFESQFGLSLKGFHPPEDAWSRDLIKMLLDRQFLYDIVIERDSGSPSAYYVCLRGNYFFRDGRMFLRIPSACDDWMLVSKNATPREMLACFLSHFSESHRGLCFAVGFHPWLIGLTKERMDTFEEFVRTIAESESVITFTGKQIAEWYINKSSQL